MKPLFVLASGMAALAVGFYVLYAYVYNEEQPPMNAPTTNSPVEIIPIEHATGVLKWGDAVIYFDPTGGAAAFAGQPPPNIILLTDIHSDHLNADTLNAVSGDAAIIAPQAVQDLLPDELAARTVVLRNGESTMQAGFTIEATPMYNVPESAEAFHSKGRGNGYIIERDGFRVYIAGDTADTPEMRALTDIDIALVPMNLPYTMSVDDAAAAVLAFKPKTVYPFHYRGPDGLADVSRFKQLVSASDPNINVMLAVWYPSR